METTRDKVLSTPELLEHILLRLDMRTLLVSALRVCRQWYDHVTRSPLLQKHLFFRPAPEIKAKVQNPLLRELFPFWLPPPISYVQEQDLQEEADKFRFSVFDLEKLPLARGDLNAAFMYEHASWRHMLLQQPPVQAIGQLQVISSRMGTGMNRYCIRQGGESKFEGNDKGLKQKIPPLRMDAFYDLVTKADGITHHWVFFWGDSEGHHRLPKKVAGHVVDESLLGGLRSLLAECGVLMIEQKTIQCSVGSRPWSLDSRLIFKHRDCHLRVEGLETGICKKLVPRYYP